MATVKLTPESAIAWLQVIAVLVQTGKVTVEAVMNAIHRVRGNTDKDTQAEDNAVLATLHAEIAGCYAKAKAESQRTK